MQCFHGFARIAIESHIYEKFLTGSRGWALAFLRWGYNGSCMAAGLDAQRESRG